jgi:predicted peptidase
MVLGQARSAAICSVSPNCGGRSWILDEQPEQLDRLYDTPIWVFHGEQDSSVPLQEPLQLVQRVRDCSGSVRVTIYPDAEHTIWPLAYRDRELFDWLLQQHRSGEAA